MADRRIRYKGKFINEEQAKELLGLDEGEYSFEYLRDMMMDRFRPITTRLKS